MNNLQKEKIESAIQNAITVGEWELKIVPHKKDCRLYAVAIEIQGDDYRRSRWLVEITPAFSFWDENNMFSALSDYKKLIQKNPGFLCRFGVRKTWILWCKTEGGSIHDRITRRSWHGNAVYLWERAK